MPRRKPEEEPLKLPPPAKTLEGRNDQLVAQAFDAVEIRIATGQASSQEYVHFLRQGSPQMILQMRKLEGENELLKSRVQELEAKTSSESLYAEALKAFRGYAGIDPIEEDDGYDY